MIGDPRFMSGAQWSAFRSRVDGLRRRIRECGADSLADPARLRALLLEVTAALSELCDLFEPSPLDAGLDPHAFDPHRGPVGF